MLGARDPHTLRAPALPLQPSSERSTAESALEAWPDRPKDYDFSTPLKNPKLDASLFEKANDEAARQQWDSVIQTLTPFLDKNPLHHDARFLRAKAFHHSGMPYPAKLDLTTLIKSAPRHFDAHTALLRLYLAAGQREAALNHLTKHAEELSRAPNPSSFQRLTARLQREVQTSVSSQQANVHGKTPLIGDYYLGDIVDEQRLYTLREVTHRVSGRQLLMKIFDYRRYSHKKSDGERFLRSVEASKRLSHPHVVRIIEGSWEPKKRRYWIVYPKVHALPWKDWLQTALPTYQESIRQIIGLGELVASLCDSGDVDRFWLQTSIENSVGILGQGLKLDCTGLLPKIDASDMRVLPSSGTSTQDLVYRAPELVDNVLNGTESSLQYSLAAVLYELTSGKAPFSEKTSRKLIMAILRKLPPEIPGLPIEFNKTLIRAMAKKSVDRFESLPCFLEQLRTLL